ncbi:MYND finger family protein [Metarhizium album ARSEF 1941]|uniref:MYND finger family protein n=1 Tax=Metarhizium album (strain ARSEF 1941) TaxID=1081103 RepID=A0A0B2WLU9_METAS|nr:MYND finger family protein [Metarhizium album ARSEF 1941]KHN94462.1 MYND finger family protein [Metarhizium album ARSEF 1941]
MPSIETRLHPRKHRALHATQPFQPSQTIHTFHPLILHPSLSHLTSVCTHCLRPGSPRACSRCRAAYYCNASCQRAAWAAVHSYECEALQQHKLGSRRGADLPAPVRALLQTLLKKEIEDGVTALDGHSSERRKGKCWSDLEMMALAACAFAGKQGESDVHKAVELLCKIQTNAFHRWDADLGQVGVFLEPTLAMANHSCIPNAVVQFIGRKAVLMAERPIEAGDEIEISYTDYTMPLSARREALKQYSFECACARCRGDLNVYQVRAAYPNTCSVIDVSSNKHAAVTDKHTQDVAARCTAEPAQLPLSLPARYAALKAQYQLARALIDANLWAVSPVPQLLAETAIYFAERDNFPYALFVAALIATWCDPFRYAAPFHPVRLKNLFMMAKLLANTAENTVVAAAPAAKGGLDQKLQQTLLDMDQVSLCQMLLIMVLKMCPGELANWDLCVSARDMLADIGKLPGRDKELSLINGWAAEEEAEVSRMFFEYAVVKQVGILADLGRDVMKSMDPSE